MLENEIEESTPIVQKEFRQNAHVENVAIGLQWPNIDCAKI